MATPQAAESVCSSRSTTSWTACGPAAGSVRSRSARARAIAGLLDIGSLAGRSGRTDRAPRTSGGGASPCEGHQRSAASPGRPGPRNRCCAMPAMVRAHPRRGKRLCAAGLAAVCERLPEPPEPLLVLRLPDLGHDARRDDLEPLLVLGLAQLVVHLLRDAGLHADPHRAAEECHRVAPFQA